MSGRRRLAGELAVSHVGPSLHARGGISSVLRTLSEEGRFPGYRVRFLTTASGRSGPVAVGASFVRAFGVALGALVSPRGIYHLHVASRGSFYRKAIVFGAARLRGHGTVVHLHGGRFHRFVERSGRLTQALVRWVFGRADAVVVLAPEWRERVAAFSGRRDAVVVPNPVRLPAAVTTGAEDAVVFLGRLGPVKGVPELLEAASALQRRGNTTTRWVLAGDGDASVYAEAVSRMLAPERIEFAGWLSRDDVGELLGGCRVFCLPSFDEGKPVALLEAMAYGLACVATSVGGVPDVVVHDQNGLLVEAGDVAGLADALGRCIEDGGLRQRLGERARATVEDGYSVGRVSAILLGVYDDVRGTMR